MAVLVEALSVIVRRDSTERNFIGGWQGFLKTVPNRTLCNDAELARVGFMDLVSVHHYVEELEQYGLIFLEHGEAVDIVVCDQIKGPTTKCDWIEFGQLPIEDEHKVSAAWLFEGPRAGAGLHFKSLNFSLAVPDVWKYEGSLSDNGQYHEREDIKRDLEFLRIEDGIEVYWNKNTNKEVYVGRLGNSKPLAPAKLLS